MNAKKMKLKNSSGVFVAPVTSPEAVIDEAGKTLKQKLSEIDIAISSGGSTNEGVTTDTSGYFYEVENLIDYTKLTTAYVSPSNGTEANQNGSSTDFIQVQPSTKYITNFAVDIMCYDANKVFIQTVKPNINNDSNLYAPRPFTTPANTKYVRINIGGKEKTMLLIGDRLPLNATYIGGQAPIFGMDATKKYLSLVNDDLDEKYSLSTQLHPLYRKKINFLGDSITNANYWGQDPGQPNETVKGYHKFMAERFDLLARNYGIGGTGFVNNAGTQTTFSQRIVSMDADADVIVVYGGHNDQSATLGTFDSTDTATFYGAVHDVCNQLKAKYPNKPIIFLVHFLSSSTLTPINNAVKEVCNYYAIPWIDLAETILKDPDTRMKTRYFKDADGVHPNTTGHKVMARFITRKMTDILMYP